jgi:hypothetical protein
MINEALIMYEFNGTELTMSNFTHYIDMLNIDLKSKGFKRIKYDIDRMVFMSPYSHIEGLIINFIKSLGIGRPGQTPEQFDSKLYYQGKYLMDLCRVRYDINTESLDNRLVIAYNRFRG